MSYNPTILKKSSLGYNLSPAPVSWHTGKGVPYSTSGFKLKYNNTEWDHLYNQPAAKTRSFIVNQGTPHPLAHEQRVISAKDLPEDKFIFSQAIASPLCCPSQYSTSTGCVCTSLKHRNTIISRGGNRPGCMAEYPFL